MKLYFLSFTMLFSVTLYGQVNDSQYTPLVNEGLEFLRQNEFSKAVEKYNAALELDSVRVDAWYGLGVSYTALCLQQDDYCGLAVAKLHRVERLAGAYRYTYQNIISCLIKIKNYASAITYCDKAIAQDSKDGDNYYYKGFAQLQLGKTKEGCNDLQYAAQLGHIDAIALQNKSCK